MTRVLVVNKRLPWPLTCGNALRVFELARHREPDIECHLACLPSEHDQLAELQGQGVFDSITVLPAADSRKHWRRYIRRGNRDYWRLAYPKQSAATHELLRGIVENRSIDVVVSVLDRSEQLTRPLVGVAKLVDQYDCFTLAHERQLAAQPETSLLERWRWRHRIANARSQEAGLGQRCDLITAIGPPDVKRLQELNPGAPVERIPNGVNRDVLDQWGLSTATRRAVAFWGNLSFPVNQQAIEYFVGQVWLPYLATADVEFVIIGPHADRTLQALAAQHQGVTLAGYVDDLFGFLRQFPVMVNPMVTGSGLKNKVLEALAAGLAVVTTPLGVDAFPEIGTEHCALADEPAEFAEAILRLLDDTMLRTSQATQARDLVREHYTWESVGARWSALLRKLGGVQLR